MKIEFQFIFEQVGDFNIEDQFKLQVDMYGQEKTLIDDIKAKD